MGVVFHSRLRVLLLLPVQQLSHQFSLPMFLFFLHMHRWMEFVEVNSLLVFTLRYLILQMSIYVCLYFVYYPILNENKVYILYIVGYTNKFTV